MRTTTDYKGLYKAASFALFASGILLFVYSGIALWLGPAPTTTPQFLNFLSGNSLLVGAGFAILIFAFVLVIPAVFAIYHLLRDTSIGRAVVGSAFFVAGIFVLLANAGNYFWLINIAIGYTSQCVTNCQQINQAAATSTNSVQIDFFIGNMLIAVGLIILGLAMLKSAAFGRSPGILGILSGLFSLLVPPWWGFVNLSLSAYPVVGTLILYGVWSLVTASRLYRLP